MIQHTHIPFFSLLVAGLFFFLPHPVHAAVTYVTSDVDTVYVGDTIAMEIRMNTEGQPINVVEGDLQLDSHGELMEIKEISVSGSNITLWSRKPSLSEDRKTISFAGGIPGGFTQPDGLLFKVFFQAKSPGKISFIPRDVKSYINDGKGTLSAASSKSFSIPVVASSPDHQQKDEWVRVVSSDIMPPEFLAATPGQDEETMGDKMFLMIQGTDYQSGIDHYEVKEGNSEFIRTGNIYVLQDQTLSVPITIKAVDKAGNERTLIIQPTFAKRYGRLILLISAGVVLLGIVSFIFFKKRKK